jgi:NAD(P)-dependent dehydrogenase (short-subunit alcohol dehydrogenase family)
MRIIVTGVGGALGSVVARAFLDAGHEVVGAAFAAKTRLEADTGTGYPIAYFDASDDDAVREAYGAITMEYGDVDGLVHCAGGFRWSHTSDLSDDDIDFLLMANLKSSLLMLRAVLGPMKERGFGRVVFVSSKSTLSPGAGEGAYTATKAGINALVKATAAEVAGQDITINAVLPSIIDTPANREAMPDADHSTWVPRESIAEVIKALVAPGLGDLSGALVPVSR